MKITRLSNRKIMLKYKLPIYIDGELLTQIEIKLRYLHVVFEDDNFDFKMIGNFNKLKNFISQKTKIKAKLFNFGWLSRDHIKMDDELYVADWIIKRIDITDVSFVRDYKIKKILENDF